jgi:hypothetical protein
MKVKELIVQLQGLQQDAEVFIDVGEGTLDTADSIEKVHLKVDGKVPRQFGRYTVTISGEPVDVVGYQIC